MARSPYREFLDDVGIAGDTASRDAAEPFVKDTLHRVEQAGDINK